MTNERKVSRVDRRRLRRAVRMMLLAIGEDPDRAGLLATPQRVADFWEESLAARDIAVRGLPVDLAGYDDMVAVKNIDFISICEHHLLPFAGVAHVAYKPSTVLLGFSDVPRLVHRASAALTMQERLTQSIVEEVRKASSALGVVVVLEARHSCVSDRGVRMAQAQAVTIATSGVFDETHARREAIAFLMGTGAQLEVDEPTEQAQRSHLDRLGLDG